MSETVIVGGGLAGGAAATLLARDGARVLLLEREAEPVDKVCGEFVSIEAQDALRSVGIDLDRLGATRIGTMRLAWGDRRIEARLPFVARGITRRRLDAALLDAAQASGAAVARGTAARAVADGCVETAHGTLRPSRILLASGKHDLRGAARETATADTGYIGFKTYWRLPRPAQAALAGMIDVVLFDGGYAGLQLVEGGVANLCLLVRKRRFAALGGRWPALLATLLAEPHLARMLGDGAPLLARPLAIAGVPYGFLHRGGGDLFRLGDQAAVIPSFCGDGMAIALHSARVAAETIRTGGDAAAHQRRLQSDLAGQLRLAMFVQRAGERARRATWGALALMPALAPLLVRATRVRA